MYQLQLFLNQCKKQSLVLGISETWLDSTITDSIVALPGYVHHRDRNRKGGGVMVYVSHHVCGKQRLDLENDEHYGLKLRSVRRLDLENDELEAL